MTVEDCVPLSEAVELARALEAADQEIRDLAELREALREVRRMVHQFGETGEAAVRANAVARAALEQGEASDAAHDHRDGREGARPWQAQRGRNEALARFREAHPEMGGES